MSHGQPEAVKDVIQKALDAGIKVVVKDIDIGNPNVPLVSQSDHDIARQVLDEALKENGDKFNAGYVFVAGFRPLELRGEVWADVKKAHPGIEEKAVWGAVDFEHRYHRCVADRGGACVRILRSPSCSRPMTNSLAA